MTDSPAAVSVVLPAINERVCKAALRADASASGLHCHLGDASNAISPNDHLVDWVELPLMPGEQGHRLAESLVVLLPRRSEAGSAGHWAPTLAILRVCAMVFASSTAEVQPHGSGGRL